MIGGGRRRQILAILLVALVVTGAGTYAVLGRPDSSSGGGGPTSVSVALGPPVGGHVTCGDGHNMVTERVGWVSSSSPVTTAQFRLEVQEIGDGDVIGADNGPGIVSTTNLCVGSSQSYVFDWYGVLQSPNGTNEATYTYADGWQGVGSTTIPIAVIDNSTLVVVSVGSFLGLGYALEVLPYGSGAPVNGFTSL